MSIKYIIITFALLSLSSCYNVNKPNKPDNLISKEKMVNVLIDMAVMSSAKSVNKKIIEKNGIIPDKFIYKKNNIDSITFAQSNAYYAFDIKKYEAIYKSVKDSLRVLRDKYKAIDLKEKAEKKVKDSIRKLQRGKGNKENFGKNNKGRKLKLQVAPLKKG